MSLRSQVHNGFQKSDIAFNLCCGLLDSPSLDVGVIIEFGAKTAAL